MAFNRAEPADTTKIRSLGTVIRPNFIAIEDGEATFLPKSINLNNRTVSGPTNDPTAILNSYMMYCKDSASGSGELYGVNDSSEIIQFTSGLPTLATTGEIFLPGGLILKWGSVSISSTPAATTYPVAFPTATLAVFLTQTENSVNSFTPYAYSYTASSFVTSTGGGTRINKYLALGH